MLGFIWRQLRGRAGRSVALLAGVLVATTGFVVLTGATTTSRLDVTGTVERNTRAAYDILVRPKGARTPLETERGLVRPNYLSGLFGGITTVQYDQVKAVAGVQVAAPIAMLGHADQIIGGTLDLTDTVDRTLVRQVVRVDLDFTTDRGLSTGHAKPRYVYVTKHPLIYPDFRKPPGDQILYTDGARYPAAACGTEFYVPREVQPDGRSLPVCNPMALAALGGPGSTLSELDAISLSPARLLADGRFEYGSARDGRPPAPQDRLTMPIGATVSLLLAAVDPVAESRLVGLDAAIRDGQMLPADKLPARVENNYGSTQEFPVLATTRPFVDGAVSATYRRLRPARVAGLPPDVVETSLGRAPGLPVGGGRDNFADRYLADIRNLIQRPDQCCGGDLENVVQAGPPEYEQLPGGVLRPRVVPVEQVVYGSELVVRRQTSWLTGDASFRPVSKLGLSEDSSRTLRSWRPVGTFDPLRLTGFDELSRVPLETYEPPMVEGADDRSRTALGGQPLLPNGSPGGYLSAPPLLLTNLASVPALLEGGSSRQRKAPISAIRVRVADVDGYSERSAEKVRLVAEQIAQVTGLDVDITLGSSPAPQTVDLPAGSFGRPELRLTENWSALGVASAITRAVDRKSAALFALVLVVCVLFLGNAVSAAVRDRRPELAVLACLGWPARRIGALILGEVAALGLAAGLLSVGLAFPLGTALDIDIDWRRALLALPVALLLALVAGLAPALRAARAHPAAALRPPVAAVRWVRRPRTLPGLALVNLVRTPGRTLLGAGALAIGVAALTLVGAAAYAFRGAIVGSLLGDTVSLAVRGADALAAIATVLLGAAAVADVLYLNIRDRAAELATLRATGWTDAALGRLIGYEGLLLGALGALSGAGLGLGGAAWLVGDLPGSLMLVAGTVAMAGVLVTCLAALVPAALLRRLPTARLLAEE
ncbi:FtsX-like permease family protein [Micromonospora sp. IBHARD004]|uniref:FtsX-like permease family protein n=1 Tax=Micromonospora sp. IBHARD004 TaxID=3457764 RepID=UPI004058E9D2